MNYELTRITLTYTDVINDIGQFRFVESDTTKKRLSAVSNIVQTRNWMHVVERRLWSDCNVNKHYK